MSSKDGALYDELSPALKEQVDAYVNILILNGLITNDEHTRREITKNAANLILSALSILKSRDTQTIAMYNTFK